jgi:hypothetical protein
MNNHVNHILLDIKCAFKYLIREMGERSKPVTHNALFGTFLVVIDGFHFLPGSAINGASLGSL